MQLSYFISELLFRFECIVVPGFGGFVANKISAKIDQKTNTFYPPSKKITFNPHLKHNDGLLTNLISRDLHVSYEVANEKINNAVQIWNKRLKKDTLELSGIGRLFKNNEGKIIFEPSASNFLTDSYGLEAQTVPLIGRLDKIKTPIASLTRKHKKKSYKFLKLAASVAILLTFSSFGYKSWQQQQLVNQEQIQQNLMHQKIQKATFVIDDPLPAIKLAISKKHNFRYHLIAGAYRVKANAHKKAKQLQKLGYESEVLQKNKWNLSPVTYGSFPTKKEAYKNLMAIRKNHSASAWLLVKQF